MKIVTAAEMREIDRLTSDHFGVPSLTLMENAGGAVTTFALGHYPNAHRVLVVCGKGNNGGDGLVAARKLREAGRDVQVVLLAEPSELRGDAAEMFRQLAIKAKVVLSSEELHQAVSLFDAGIILDAILGTGFRPPVSGLYADAISVLNDSKAPVISVDIPSGADADVVHSQSGPLARADAIVTFTAPRPAHIFGILTAGPTLVAPIGSPAAAVHSSLQLNVITASDIARLLAPRTREANKGSYGHVLVIGGSLGKSGAAAMAGMAVLRCGAGLSTIATPKSVLSAVASFHPEVMTEPLEETDEGTISMRAFEYAHLDKLVEKKTVLAIGPGISRHPETSEFVRTAIMRFDTPIVLDADGLNAFEGQTQELSGNRGPVVITPHPGEMSRLTGMTIAAIQQDRIKVARNFAREHNLIVVLKGHRTLVASPDGEIWVNTSGNPGMATGGTGDVLTGVVAGLIAQYPGSILEATIAAVHLHGMAGDVACEKVGEQSLVATDLIHALPQAMQRARFAAREESVLIPA